MLQVLHLVGADDELGDLVVSVATALLRQRHVAYGLTVPRIAAAHEWTGGMRQAAAIRTELVAPVQMSVLRQAADVERIALHGLLARQRVPVLGGEDVI